MFFDNWEGIYRTLIIAVLTYPVLILMLRVSGKRTLSKMNMFDFIVTIALGSTVATILLNSDIAYAEGLTALAILILLQYIVTWLSVRSSGFNKIIKGEPRLLYYKGAFIGEAMRKERMNEDEIRQAVRKNGKASFEKIEAVVLETDGSLTVVETGTGEKETVLKNLKGE